MLRYFRFDRIVPFSQDDYKHYIGGGSIAVGVTETKVADADHSQIVIGTGPGISPIVRVFDITTNQAPYTPVREVKSVRPNEVGGVNVAVGEIFAKWSDPLETGMFIG